MTLARKLKFLLTDRKAGVIAERAGISAQSLSAYVNKGVMPQSDVAVKLADALGVDVGWLLDPRREWPPVPSETPFVPPVTQTAA